MDKDLKILKLGIFLAISIASVNSFADCFQKRAVIEFGSGNTKALVANVNTCVTPNKFVPIARIEEPIQYRNNTVMMGGVRYLSQKVMTEGKIATLKILKKIKDLEVDQVQAIATSVFRSQAIDENGTINGRLYLNSLTSLFNLKITVLGQYQEGILSAEAAISELSNQHPDFQRQDLIIWDIGGGSTQIVLPGEKIDEYDGIYLGEYGSATIQEYVNAVLKNITSDITCSANPVELTHVTSIFGHVKKLIEKKISPELGDKILSRKTIIGIGGVHKYSNCELIYGAPHCRYNTKDLYYAIEQYAGLTDQQLYDQGRCSEFKYCRDKITNAAMIYTLMTAMGKTEVQTAMATAKEGVMITPSFW